MYLYSAPVPSAKTAKAILDPYYVNGYNRLGSEVRMPISTIDEVIWRAKRFRHEEARRESEDYLELVIYQDSLLEFRQLLEDYFGPAFEGDDPGLKALQHAGKYGGIGKDQVLYYTEKEQQPSLAMIWPWSDGRRATLKIIQSGDDV